MVSDSEKPVPNEFPQDGNACIRLHIRDKYAIDLTVGRVAIDNNVAERDIKSVVIGRKNWLFADSVAGVNTNAVMYSLVETAKANGLNPYDYLSYVIKTMPMLRTAAEMLCLLLWKMPRPASVEELLAA